MMEIDGSLVGDFSTVHPPDRTTNPFRCNCDRSIAEWRNLATELNKPTDLSFLPRLPREIVKRYLTSNLPLPSPCLSVILCPESQYTRQIKLHRNNLKY
jgi:hypothetical protein